MADRFGLEKIRVHPPKGAEDLLRQIENVMELRQAETLTSGWQIAQAKRQAELGIRGGGAPASRAEAAAMLDELLRQKNYILANAHKITPEQAAALLEEHYQATVKLNTTLAGDKVAILFKSGGPFLYTNSIPSDYNTLRAAPSKGKEVWRMGWGPNRSPAYVPIAIRENRVRATQPVSSSWLRQIWLIADVELD